MFVGILDSIVIKSTFDWQIQFCISNVNKYCEGAMLHIAVDTSNADSRNEHRHHAQAHTHTYNLYSTQLGASEMVREKTCRK